MANRQHGVKFMRMKRRSFLSSSAALAGAGVLGSADGHEDQFHPHQVHAASLMTECANPFSPRSMPISAAKRHSVSWETVGQQLDLIAIPKVGAITDSCTYTHKN